MTEKQNQIHARAMGLAREHRRVEADLIVVLQEVERLKVHRHLDQPSVFMYATKILGLSESVAYALISVSRKSMVIPELMAAIESHKLSVSKASRIVSSLDGGNAKSLVDFACNHSAREIDFELAKNNPKARVNDKVKVLSQDQIQITVTISKKAYEDLKRCESLLAQRGKDCSSSRVVEVSVAEYVCKHDPVKKAERAIDRRKQKEIVLIGEDKSEKEDQLCTYRVQKNQRQKLTAEQKHAVFARDQGKCTHKNIEHIRCDSDKWIDVHHIIPISKGGTNDLDNLTTLCSFHHDLVHQLTLPIEGQLTWLRSPRVEYRVASKLYPGCG